jgi:ribonucleoside-diphosphate reductase alpha chain
VQNIIARRKGEPVAQLGTPEAVTATPSQVIAGRKCPECGAHAMIRKDGCDFCTQCGHVGACG